MRHCFIPLLAVALASACSAPAVHEDAGFACGDITDDVKNCGQCGHVCTAPDDVGMAVCSAGTCAEAYTLASGQTNPVALAANSASVFWVNQGSEDANEDYNDDGALVSVPIGGGNPLTIASMQLNPTSVVLDSSHVYWSNLGYREEGGAYDSGSGSVMKAPLPSGSGIAVSGNVTEPGVLALAGSDILWISTVDFQVYSAPLSGATPSTFATGPEGGYVMMATDANNAYLASGIALVKIALSGNTPVTLSTDVSDPRGIAVDATNVYWTDYDEAGDGEVLQVPIAGGKTITIADELEGPVGIATDGRQVYWADQWGGDIGRVPVGGGDAVTIVSGQNEPLELTLDATSVYWVDRESGDVMKVTPR